MRKLVYSTLAFGAAMAVAFGAQAVNVAAENETTAKSAVTEPSLNGDILSVEAGEGSQEVVVGVAKKKKVNNAYQYVASAWDTYAVDSEGKVSIDLSKYAKTKDIILQFKADLEGEDVTPLTVVVPKSKKLKATYDKANAEISVSADGSDYTGTLSLSTESGWVDDVELTTESKVIKNTNFSALPMYQMSGGALYLTTVPAAYTVEEHVVTAKSISEIDSVAVSNAVQTIERPSKAVKVSISKLANAPKLKVNYKTGKITTPKDSQARLVKTVTTTAEGEGGEETESVDVAATWNITAGTELTVSADAAADINNNQIPANKNFAIDVKTVKSGKPDSKVGHYIFGSNDATKIDDITGEIKGTTSGTTTKYNGTLTNTSTKYAYKITYNGNKSVTIKAGGNNTGNLKNVDLAQDIEVERVGDAKTFVWAGEKEKLYDKTTKAVAEGVNPAFKVTVTGSSDGEDGKTTTDTFKITVDGHTTSITSGGTGLKENDEIEIVMAAGYVIEGIDELSLTDFKAETTTEGVTTYTFKMPKKNLDLKAVETYSIDVTASNTSADKTSAVAGDKVKITSTDEIWPENGTIPNRSYKVWYSTDGSTWTELDAEQYSDIDATNGKYYSFTMPAGNVKVGSNPTNS